MEKMVEVRFSFVIPMAIFVILSLFASVSEAAHTQVRGFASVVLNIHSLSDWFIQTMFVTLAYIGIYILGAGIFEYTNPAPKNEKRVAEIKLELRYGVTAMFFNIFYTTTWIWLVEPNLYFFGYFEDHSYSVSWFILNFMAYFFVFDTWFYWTHISLHITKPINIWYIIHRHHHQFVDPTAFAQDAVHPFEAVYQGPMGHYMVCLLTPMHPVIHSLFGFLTSMYAIAAHDGRAGDLNDHTKHHHYKSCNYGLYWGFWDWVCGTRYDPKKYPKRVTQANYLN